MSLKHKLKVLCASNDMSLLDIMRAYNKKYGKAMVSQTYYQMINNDNIKWNTLTDMLDSVGYEIVFRRKRDVDQWNCFSKLNWIQRIEVADVYGWSLMYADSRRVSDVHPADCNVVNEITVRLMCRWASHARGWFHRCTHSGRHLIHIANQIIYNTHIYSI